MMRILPPLPIPTEGYIPRSIQPSKHRLKGVCTAKFPLPNSRYLEIV